MPLKTTAPTKTTLPLEGEANQRTLVGDLKPNVEVSGSRATAGGEGTASLLADVRLTELLGRRLFQPSHH